MAQNSDSLSVARRVTEEFYNGNLDAADELFGPRFTSHAWWHNPVEMVSGEAVSGGEESTPDTEKAGASFWRERYPDAQWKIEEIIPTQAPNKVVALWTSTGSSTNGKRYSIKGIDIYRIGDGKIVEQWATWDRLGFWQQMGLVPSTAELRAAADNARLVPTGKA
jgi:predicted ester cyclase